MKENKLKKGFTLLELLIVIAIIAILSVILIIVINPAETLKKARDVQRMSDLATVKTALGLVLTASSTPFMDGTVGNTLCKNGSGNDSIWYSYPSDTPGAAITDVTLDFSAVVGVQKTAANITKPDGTGWVPVAFSNLTGGSPISNLPIDPVNTIAAVATVANTDLVYRYACDANDLTFELGAVLESTAYKTDDPKMSTDGGNNANYYEVGTKLTILDGATAQY